MSYSVLLLIDVQDVFEFDSLRWSRCNDSKFESIEWRSSWA